jgi:IS1 family transposase
MPMNKLSRDKRVHIISLLVEGVSLRAITRITGCSINTVTSLLVIAGKACSEFQDRALRNLICRRVQVDEIWAFSYCKEKAVATAKAAPDQAGDLWTFVALDSDTKLVPAWMVGSRDTKTARAFVDELASRIATRIQLTSDGYRPYVVAVMDAFEEVDYAMLVSTTRCRRQKPRLRIAIHRQIVWAQQSSRSPAIRTLHTSRHRTLSVKT